MGRKGRSGMSGGSSGAGGSVAESGAAYGGGISLTSAEEAVLTQGFDYAKRDWLDADEEWAYETDPKYVAQDIVNFEERGRSWDDDVINKLDDFGFHFNMDTDEQYEAAKSVGIKLQTLSNRNLLRNNPEVKAEYDRIKRNG